MKNGKLIKVCGMTSGRNIRAVEKLGVDMIGMVFYPASPRFVSKEPDYLPDTAERVGVFVNAGEEAVLRCVVKYGLDMVQLHGAESPDFCARLSKRGVGVIKAFGIASAADFGRVSQYEGTCRYFLFDTRSEAYGGSGRSFDWSLLENYKGSTRFLLSGGIGPDSAASLSAVDHPMLAGFDLNSMFESAPGVKNVRLIENFLNEI
ncbi:MAG: phosphoribosylanthranilate isomerase [Bacteroidales bacterium]|nr:phosphoribosylanthranilate isomerase [Bacteroidales bacterium]